MEEPTLVLVFHIDSVEREVILNHIKNNTLQVYFSRYRSSHLMSIVIFKFDFWSTHQEKIQKSLIDVFLGSKHRVKFIYGAKSMWSMLSNYIEKEYTIRVISNQISKIPNALRTKVVDTSYGQVKIVKLDKLKGYVDRVPIKLKFISLESQVARCKIMFDKNDVLPSTWTISELYSKKEYESTLDSTEYSVAATDGIQTEFDTKTEIAFKRDEDLTIGEIASWPFRLNAYITVWDKIIEDHIVHKNIVEKHFDNEGLQKAWSGIISRWVKTLSLSDGEKAIFYNKKVLAKMLYSVLNHWNVVDEDENDGIWFNRSGVEKFINNHDTPQYYENIIANLIAEYRQENLVDVFGPLF